MAVTFFIYINIHERTKVFFLFMEVNVEVLKFFFAKPLFDTNLYAWKFNQWYKRIFIA